MPLRGAKPIGTSLLKTSSKSYSKEETSFGRELVEHGLFELPFLLKSKSIGFLNCIALLTYFSFINKFDFFFFFSFLPFFSFHSVFSFLF